jgi:hypothetical protein
VALGFGALEKSDTLFASTCRAQQFFDTCACDVVCVRRRDILFFPLADSEPGAH